MRELQAYVQAAEMAETPCPNSCGPAWSGAWTALTDQGAVTIGHTLACGSCRPDGVFVCESCGLDLPMDGELIADHVRGCLRARHG